MSRGLFSFLALTFTLGPGIVAEAHHPPKMERCESLAFTGQIERIAWRHPHVQLYIRTNEGVTHHVAWLAINQLGLDGIQEDTLRIGDEVIVIAGIRSDDVTERPILLSYIHRNSDGWGWSQTPEGC